MELSDYLRILRAHWVGVMLFGALGLVAAWAFTASQPVVYAANANGFVSTGMNGDPALASVNDSLAKSRAKSYVDLATSRATAQKVIDELDLDTSPSSLIARISVDQPIDTVLIKITAEASSPEEAQALADAWVGALAEQVEEVENPSGARAPGSLRVVPVEAAALPTSPASPRPDRNLALGLLLGLLLGVGYAVVRSQLDRRLRDALAVEKELGIPVVGSIPATEALSRKDGRVLVPLTGSAGDASGAGEAFRKLRTNIAYMDVDDPPRQIVVSSASPSDGKSTIAASLATAIAAAGQRVTLVEADLRRPSLAGSFALDGSVGLTDVLVGRVPVADALQGHPDFPNLDLLVAGAIPPNPSELLGSRAMRALLDQLAEEGMVVLDAPPLLPVTDAAVLTAHCHGAILVVSYGKTLDSDLAAAVGSVRAVHGRVLGVVFNRVPRRNTAGGYYGGYYRSRTPDPAPAQQPGDRPQSA